MNENHHHRESIWLQVMNLIDRCHLSVQGIITHQIIRKYWEIGCLIQEHLDEMNAKQRQEWMEAMERKMQTAYSSVISVVMLKAMADFAKAYPQESEIPFHSGNIDFAKLCHLTMFHAFLLSTHNSHYHHQSV